MKINEMYDLSKTIAAPLFENKEYPWEVLPLIGDYIIELGKTLSLDEYDLQGEDVWISKSAVVAPTASISGPAVICAGAEIRHGAFIRGRAIVGENVVVGNSTELKNVILFNNVQVPHYNYVGDSILGYRAHMGAGSICSNVKSDKSVISVNTSMYGNGTLGNISTGLKKMGAALADHVEVGCNSVLNPGTVVGRNTNIYPLSRVRGYVPGNSIFKDPENIVLKH